MHLYGFTGRTLAMTGCGITGWSIKKNVVIEQTWSEI